jgi:hypothetical protein
VVSELCIEGRDAAALLELASEGERVCAAMKALMARRVDETGVWRKGGHRSAAGTLEDVERRSRIWIRPWYAPERAADQGGTDVTRTQEGPTLEGLSPRSRARLRAWRHGHPGAVLPERASVEAGKAEGQPMTDDRALDATHAPLWRTPASSAIPPPRCVKQRTALRPAVYPWPNSPHTGGTRTRAEGGRPAGPCGVGLPPSLSVSGGRNEQFPSEGPVETRSYG